MPSVSHIPKQVSELRDHFEGDRVCVTGGAGFIGSHLVDALVALGAHVSVIDDFSSSDASHVSRVIEACPERVRLITGSVLDPISLAAALERTTKVFHLAAVCSVPKSIEDPARSWVVNATGTMRVLSAAHKAGASRVIYSASSSAYGDQRELPKTETMVTRPESPYAASKLAGEGLCRSWSSSYGLDTVSLRYFNIFGARQSAESAYAAVIPAFAKALLSGQRPTIFGDGGQTRDFTHVSNAVYANLLASINPTKLDGEVLNVGAGTQTSILSILDQLADAMGVERAQPKHEDARRGDVRDSLADINAAKDAIGYDVITDTSAGLASAANWYKSAWEKSRSNAEHAEPS